MMEDSSKTKNQQYEELRQKQKEKYLEQEAIRKGIVPGTSQPMAQNEIDALENMDLDRKVDDSQMYDQFNPMASNTKKTGLQLKEQNKFMGKDTTQK